MSRHEPIEAFTDREALMLALVEGELDAGREAAAMAALTPGEAARVRAMRGHRLALRSVAEVAAPPGLLDRVGAVLEREAVTGPATFQIEQYRASGGWARRLAVAAGLVLMAGGVGYWSLWLSRPGPMIDPARAGREGSTIAMSGTDARDAALEQTKQAGPTLTIAATPPEPVAVAAAPVEDPLADFEPPYSVVDFDDPLELAAVEPEITPSPWAGPAMVVAHVDPMVMTSAPLGVFREMPSSLDLEDAARLAEEGRLVIRIRADRPGIAAARLLAQADSRADKGRLWRLMPCPPSDFSDAVESAMPPDRTAGDPSGVTVPFRVPMRPTVEATLSVELDPSVASLAVMQAELESISEGAVIMDLLDRPVTMAPPCGDDGGLRRWTSAPSSAVHSVVVPLVVESSE